MNIPAPIKSSLKMAFYVAAIAVVTFYNDPAILDKIGVRGAVATVVAVLLKGALTWLTARKQGV